MSIRRRQFRQVATLALSVSLIAASFASTTVAATANLTLNGGLTAGGGKVSGATPSAVSPGKVAGFYVTVENDDSANLPTFFMTAATDATPYGAYWLDGAGTAHPCDTSPLRCDFGTFNAGAAVTVVAAFTLPSSTSSSMANCYPPQKPNPLVDFGVPPTSSTFVCVDFKFASNQGNVTGKNKSRGDEFHWMDFVSTAVDAKNEAAQFPYCDLADLDPCSSSLLTLSNNTTLSGQNRNLNLQSTTIEVPGTSAFDTAPGLSGLHVADGGLAGEITCTGDCASAVAAAGGFLGETSLIQVNSGQAFSPDWIKTTIVMLGVNATKVDGVVHELDDGTSDLLAPCAGGVAPAPGALPAKGCFLVVNGSGNTAIVTVYTHTNGKLRNF